MKTKNQKDAIDMLVDAVDKYYFRLGQVENVLGGSTYAQTVGDYSDIRRMCETPGGKAARGLFYENLKEVKDAELEGALEEAAIDWQNHEDSFSQLLGFVVGLRIAGLPSDRTKQMARTWRLGYPTDDKD